MLRPLQADTLVDKSQPWRTCRGLLATAVTRVETVEEGDDHIVAFA